MLKNALPPAETEVLFHFSDSLDKVNLGGKLIKLRIASVGGTQYLSAECRARSQQDQDEDPKPPKDEHEAKAMGKTNNKQTKHNTRT